MRPSILSLIFAAALTATPALAQPARDGRALFEQADIDRDGRITRMEYLAARAGRFDALDRGRKGYLTRDDFQRLGGERPMVAKRMGDMFARADTDRDGRLTRWEFDHAPTPIFDRADADRDGVVERSERNARGERRWRLR